MNTARRLSSLSTPPARSILRIYADSATGTSRFGSFAIPLSNGDVSANAIGLLSARIPRVGMTLRETDLAGGGHRSSVGGAARRSLFVAVPDSVTVDSGEVLVDGMPLSAASDDPKL